MLFSELCEVSDRLDSKPGYIVSIDLVSEWLQTLKPGEVYPAIRLMLNDPTPVWGQDYSPLNVRILVDLTCKKSGLPEKRLSKLITQTKDLSTAIELALESRKRRLQNTQKMGITVKEIYLTIRELLEQTPDRDNQSFDELERLFDTMRPNEVKHLVRNLILEGHIGSCEGILEEAISKLSSIELSEIKHRNALVNDIALIGQAALSKGKESLSELRLEVLRPIRPMTAVTAQNIEETNKEYQGLVGYEFKPDGIRVQIHKSGDNVRFFDRKLRNISHLLPDLTRRIVDNIGVENAILEGEIIPRDSQGKPAPYSVLVGELRSRELGQSPTPGVFIDLELFELLFLDNQNLLGITYTCRRQILVETSGKIPVISQIQTADPREAESFYSKALENGYEGLLAKHLYSTYIPGIRTPFWAKIKESPKNLDLVITSVCPFLKRKNNGQVYLLSSRDLRTNRFIPVAECSEGLSTDERRWLDKKLEEVTLEETKKGSFVLPKIVLEISFKAISRVPSAPGGYWLDSPRAIRVRLDKSPREIDSLQWIKKLAEEA